MTKKKKGEETKLDDDQLGDSDEENKTTNNNNNHAKEDNDDLGKEKKNVITDLNHYKPAFRELDIEVGYSSFLKIRTSLN